MLPDMVPTAEETAMDGLVRDYMRLLEGEGGGDSPLYSDVVFMVEGKVVHAHRCILAARSRFFRALFSTAQPPAPPLEEAMQQLDDCARNNHLRRRRRHVDPPNSLLPSASSLFHIPAGVVSHDAFLVLLRFLYTGRLHLLLHRRPPNNGFGPSSEPSPQRSGGVCSRSHYHHQLYPSSPSSSILDVALDTLHASHFFGAPQLSRLLQKHLCEVMMDKASIEDVMKMLVAGKKVQVTQGQSLLWDSCSRFVATSGLATHTLLNHLPPHIASEIHDLRSTLAPIISSGHDYCSNLPATIQTRRCRSAASTNGGDMQSNGSEGECSGAAAELQRVTRMQQALDCHDMELVKMMVMSEGLDLDAAQALQYAVKHCSREVVKGLLEMGAVNVNAADAEGRTALHAACAMGCPDIVSLLLDHHASPLAACKSGHTPVDVVRALMSAALSPHPPSASDNHRLRLCLELLQSAASLMQVEEKGVEQDVSDGVVSDASSAAADFMRCSGACTTGGHSIWEDTCSCSYSGDGAVAAAACAACLRDYAQYHDRHGDEHHIYASADFRLPSPSWNADKPTTTTTMTTTTHNNNQATSVFDYNGL